MDKWIIAIANALDAQMPQDSSGCYERWPWLVPNFWAAIMMTYPIRRGQNVNDLAKLDLLFNEKV